MYVVDIRANNPRVEIPHFKLFHYRAHDREAVRGFEFITYMELFNLIKLSFNEKYVRFSIYNRIQIDKFHEPKVPVGRVRFAKIPSYLLYTWYIN